MYHIVEKKELNKEIIKNEINNLIEKHKGITDNEKDDFLNKVEHLLDYWENRIKAAGNANYN
ncbi:MAG: hypothetical protein NC923_06665, partial [Candidatus Omnitrophica bacterium]|nr:hypothetical protein [Candidatus Omnitrophota bacterium]